MPCNNRMRNKKNKNQWCWLGNKLWRQECIPVGCVLPASVAVSPAGMSPAMHAPLPCIPPQPCMPPFTMHTPLHYAYPPEQNFLTHACESITFPQLLLWAVINKKNNYFYTEALWSGSNHIRVICWPRSDLGQQEMWDLFRCFLKRNMTIY